MKTMKFINPENFEEREVEITEELYNVASNLQCITKQEEPNDWWKENIKLITPAFVREDGNQFIFGILTNNKTKYRVIIEEIKEWKNK